MSGLRLRSLGHTEVLRDGQLVRWGAESARNLVFFLLAYPEGRTRDEMIDALWQEDVSPRTGCRLRVALHRARMALGGPDRIVEEDGVYRLCDEALRASDVFELYASLHRAEHAQGEARLLALEQATEAYTGDFLPHIQAEWAQNAREQWRGLYTRACLERSQLYCQARRCDLAARDLALALHADPYLGENHHQTLMGCLSVVGGPYAATAYYRRFVHFLREELGDTPMPATAQLAERLKAGERLCRQRCPGPDTRGDAVAFGPYPGAAQPFQTRPEGAAAGPEELDR